MPLNVAVIGAGPWGKNHIRIYSELKEANLKYVCDLDTKLLEQRAKDFNISKITTNYKDILSDPDIKAVSICTPASTHYKVAKECLEAGKHVLVEKPLTVNSPQAEELVQIAEQKNLIIATGQVFRFDPAVVRAKEEIAKGTFGRVYYISLARMGMRKPREDCGAIFNYAAHDFDIMAYILGKELPNSVTSITSNPLKREYEDVAVVAAQFDGILAYSQVSWLPPVKIRELWVIGEKKSAFFDTKNFEMELFDSGVFPKYKSFGEFQLLTKLGGSEKIKLDKAEPLKLELQNFLHCVQTGEAPRANGKVGLNVVKMIEAALKSAELKKTVEFDSNGKFI